MRSAASSYDALGWHASHVQTISAHKMTLYERNLCAEPSRSGSSHQTGRPGSDDDKIVACCRFGILQLGRVDVSDEFLITIIVGKDKRICLHDYTPS